ncbi:Envelope glycoprotein [Gossypium arboreum]|uniref:Envelope glycoprotein n=1 Tax=Gossypium arboreum TaxID=29729 RepID=A0A0B0MDC7_GOSAR|nr:Envelope glycoprotein [Gossypium arboreum]
MCFCVRPCLGRWHQYMCFRVRPHLRRWHRYISSYLIPVRPCLGQWHCYEMTCKTTSGMLALFDICDNLSILFNSEWFNGE